MFLKVVGSAGVLSSTKTRSGVALIDVKDNPLRAVEDLVLQDGSRLTPVVIFLRRAERISSVVMSHLVLRLAASTLRKICLIAMTSDVCPLPLPSNESALSVCAVSTHVTVEPSGLFDDVMTEIYTSGALPVLFPRNIVETTHKAFVEFNMCVSSALDRCWSALLALFALIRSRLSLCLMLHMEHRRSLLCLHSHPQWLLEVCGASPSLCLTPDAVFRSCRLSSEARGRWSSCSLWWPAQTWRGAASSCGPATHRKRRPLWPS